MCTIDALNANNGLGIPTPSLGPSGGEGVDVGAVLSHNETVYGPKPLNPSAKSGSAAASVLIAPGIFVQDAYNRCMAHYGY
jgi:hypothetical protein